MGGMLDVCTYVRKNILEVSSDDMIFARRTIISGIL